MQKVGSVMSTTVTADSIQTRLLDQIKKRLPAHITLADELAELLSISRDSAYRRIRGETVLSLDEAKKLYDRYGVSIDDLFSPNSNMALFYHRALTNSYSLDQWLNSVARNLEVMVSLEEKEKEMVFCSEGHSHLPLLQVAGAVLIQAVLLAEVDPEGSQIRLKTL
jgi:hypothetical protein